MSIGSRLTTFAVFDGRAAQPSQRTYVSFPGLQAWKGENVRLLFRAPTNADEDPLWWFAGDVSVNATA